MKGPLIAFISVVLAVVLTFVGVSAESGWRRTFVTPGIWTLRVLNVERNAAPEYAIVGLAVNIAILAVILSVTATLLMRKTRR